MGVKKVFFQNSKGMKLAGWLHTPDLPGKFPAVVRSHGYRGSKGGRTSTRLVEAFSDMVYLRFDMHGHGESEGSPEEIDAAQCVDDMISAIEYISTLDVVNKDMIAITGSSLGGLATILAAAWSGKVIAAVAVCPVSDLHPFRKSHVRYQKLHDLLGRDDLYKEAEKINIPFLVVHGDKDDIVPLSQSVTLAKHLKGGTLHVTTGAGHAFLDQHHFTQMIEQIRDFIHDIFDNGKN